jgi:hypothetical protein
MGWIFLSGSGAGAASSPFDPVPGPYYPPSDFEGEEGDGKQRQFGSDGCTVLYATHYSAPYGYPQGDMGSPGGRSIAIQYAIRFCRCDKEPEVVIEKMWIYVAKGEYIDFRAVGGPFDGGNRRIDYSEAKQKHLYTDSDLVEINPAEIWPNPIRVVSGRTYTGTFVVEYLSRTTGKRERALTEYRIEVPTYEQTMCRDFIATCVPSSILLGIEGCDYVYSVTFPITMRASLPVTAEWEDGYVGLMRRNPPPGRHRIKFRDADCCEVEAVVDIPTSGFEISYSIENTCHRGCTVVIGASNPELTYTIRCSNGATARGKSARFAGLDCFGTYIFTVTTSAGCTKEVELDLSRMAKAQPMLQFELVPAEKYTQPECRQRFRVYVNDPLPPVIVQWFRQGNQSSTPDLVGDNVVVPEGTWRVVVRDASGCLGVTTVTVSCNITSRDPDRDRRPVRLDIDNNASARLRDTGLVLAPLQLGLTLNADVIPPVPSVDISLPVLWSSMR